MNSPKFNFKDNNKKNKKNETEKLWKLNNWNGKNYKKTLKIKLVDNKMKQTSALVKSQKLQVLLLPHKLRKQIDLEIKTQLKLSFLVKIVK